jgi:hypothetical protein
LGLRVAEQRFIGCVQSFPEDQLMFGKSGKPPPMCDVAFKQWFLRKRMIGTRNVLVSTFPVDSVNW